MDKRKKWILRITLTTSVVLLGFGIFLFYCVCFLPLRPDNTEIPVVKREKAGEYFYKTGESWLLKNCYGVWEMYLEGSAIERGSKAGALSCELLQKQEKIIATELEHTMCSKITAFFLRLVSCIYNCNIGRYLSEEHKEEIYALSRYGSPDLQWLGGKYQRFIGYHTLNDLSFQLKINKTSGCSALSVRGDKTADGNLLTGYNFDFYINDDFAEDKILMFIKPEAGYRHAFIAWNGIFGAISGMNENGLTVIINLSRDSDIPLSTGTPVSLIAREILQYAGNIDEAVEIIKLRKSFVPVQFILGSADGSKVVTVNKNDAQTVVNKLDSSEMSLCSVDYIENSRIVQNHASHYRQRRMCEIADSTDRFTPGDMAGFLRDKRGLNGRDIGLSNARCINRLTAHHSAIFHPASRTFWISTAPYQEGAFLAYNLDSIFDNADSPEPSGLSLAKNTIQADSAFIKTGLDFYTFYKYSINTPVAQFKRDIPVLIKSNPEHFHTYEYLGDYYDYKGNSSEARKYYRLSLSKEIPDSTRRRDIQKKLDRYS